jgi:hypothetical protein
LSEEFIDIVCDRESESATRSKESTKGKSTGRSKGKGSTSFYKLAVRSVFQVLKIRNNHDMFLFVKLIIGLTYADV